MSKGTATRGAQSWWRETATTATTILFVVAGITGVMLLFGLRNGAIKSIHEWLGLGFVIAGVVHTIRHWGMVLRYLKRANIWVTAGVVTVAAVGLVVFAGGGSRGGHGPRSHGVASLEQVVPTDDAAVAMTVSGTEQDIEIQ